MPSRPAPESYQWIGDATVTTYAVSGCLTVVVGLGPEDALRAMGADPEVSMTVAEADDSAGWCWVSAMPMEGPDVAPATLLVELGSFEGARDVVLQRLSKRGKAVSVAWTVNDEPTVTCARRGAVPGSASTLAAEQFDELPPVLRSYRRHVEQDGVDDASLVAVGMAMAEAFTGVAIPLSDAAARPAVVHPVTEPVLGLQSREGLVASGTPSDEVVLAVLAASPTAQRRVAEWAVRDALERAGVGDELDVEPIFHRFRSRGAVRLPPQISAFHRQAIRRAKAAADAAFQVQLEYHHGRRASEQDPDVDAEARHWNAVCWAMSALEYLAAPDDVQAALGAVDSAAVCVPIRNVDEWEVSRRAFFEEAIRVIASS